MRVANRQARDQRLQKFEALAAFANIGDAPEDWRNFRLQWPEFFPTTASKWGRPGFQTLTDRLYTFSGEWAKDPADLRVLSKPPLLWYRDRLRAVWASNDPTGANLYVLFGLEKQAQNLGVVDPIPITRPLLIPGQSLNPLEQETVVGLPQGTPVVNGVTGEITWKFGCDLQQSVYDLMQCRWRAKICPECGRYFIADKTAQTFCSTRCAGEKKRKRSLKYWNREGRKNRAKKQRISQRRTKQ
jgi:hypothetical protein